MSVTERDGHSFDGERLAAWWALATRHGWGGLHFQHAVLCRRRAWLHAKGLSAVNERMRGALVAHEAAYSRDRSLTGLLGLAPDRILWRERVVEEHKQGKARHECAKAQALFYAGALSAATGTPWRARLISLSARTREEWPFDAAALAWMEELAHALLAVHQADDAPAVARHAACRPCSFLGLCWGT